MTPVGSALAQSSGGFGGRPANPDPSNPRSESIFIYTIEGGDTKEDQVLVSNNGDEVAEIALYAVDGVTTNTGSYTCKQKSEARSGVGEWLRLSKDTITLEPNTNTLVDFTLTMPEDADIGEHNGCIVFENAKDEGEAVNGGAVRLRTRSAIRVVATIPGELRRDIAIANFSAATTERGKQDYALTLQNIGNVSADVDTKITLTNMFGDIVYENGGGYPVFANQKLDLNYTNTDRPFWGGWFRANVSVSYDKRAGTFGTGNAAELVTKNAEEVTLFIMPSPTALLIMAIPVVLLLMLIVWLIARKMIRKRAEREWGTYTAKASDTLEAVAAKHGVSWKKLASTNGMKAPYSLHEGQQLKVPMGGTQTVAPVLVAEEPVIAEEAPEPIEEEPVDVPAEKKQEHTKKTVKVVSEPDELDDIDKLVAVKAKRTPRNKKK